MSDLLIKLREQLVSMIEEIDSYKIPYNETIVIKKEDLKWINYLGKVNSYLHVFEFKNGVKFFLGESNSYPNQLEVYKKLLNGTLEILILNKRSKLYEWGEHEINYELEDKIKTDLRNLYGPLDDENNDETYS